MEFLQVILCIFLEFMASQDVKNVHFIYDTFKKLILKGEKRYSGAKIVKGQQELEHKTISHLYTRILIHGKENQSFQRSK